MILIALCDPLKLIFIEEEWCPKRRRWLELYYDFLLYNKLYYDFFVVVTYPMHVLYSSKDPCCSLACGHRRISGRRFSSPKWVERSDDRKYVCARRLAVPKRNNFCSRTLVHWPRPAPVTISSGWLTPFKVRRGLPYTSKSWYKFSSEILDFDGNYDICQACMFASPPSKSVWNL